MISFFSAIGIAGLSTGFASVVKGFGVGGEGVVTWMVTVGGRLDAGEVRFDLLDWLLLRPWESTSSCKERIF